MRFIHTADIHFDSPLSGLREREGRQAEDLAGATRLAFEKLVDHALAGAIDFVLIAGDVFDRDWTDYSSGLAFNARLGRLKRADIPVVLIRGNHDAANLMSRRLTWPSNVRELPVRAPGTVVLDHLGVAIHGQGFADRAVPENLVLRYPPPVPGLFNIGLLHTSANGRPGHDTYAPCELADLIARGYDYWALGHVHTREELCEDPWIVFPGNLQARHVNEPGDKGFTLVTVEAGRVVDVAHVPVDVVRWTRVVVDVSSATALDDVCPLIGNALDAAIARADGRALAVRLVLKGAGPVHRILLGTPERLEAECASVALQSRGEVWIERVEVETSPPIVQAQVFERFGDLAGLIGGVRADPAEVEAIVRELGKGLDRVPLALREEIGLAGLSPALCARILSDAEDLVMHRIAAGAMPR